MAPVQLHAGTSGFSYKEWKGSFYPADLAADRMLAFYASKLRTVEVNNTFYRMPKGEVLERWAGEVPEGFRFVIKASQRITHRARLANAGEALGYLWQAVQHLGDRRGPLLFQLPPNFKKDTERLRAFLAELPEGCRAAFEFRHDSWNDDEVYAALRERSCAWCSADTEEGETVLPPATADWGYLRLRRPDYAEADLAQWAVRIRGQPWSEAFVFFKHEDAGTAPRLAAQLDGLFSAG